jgi:hypothetical protein
MIISSSFLTALLLSSQGSTRPPEIFYNVFLCANERNLEIAQKAVTDPNARLRKDWKPADPKVQKQFAFKVDGYSRFWVDQALVETPALAAVRRLVDLAMRNGGAIEGRWQDFSEEDREAITNAFRAGANIPGPVGSIEETLKRPDGRIEISFDAEVRGMDGSGKTKSLDTISSQPKQLPAQAKPLEIPDLSPQLSRYVLAYSCNDLTARTENLPDKALKFLAELRAEKRKPIDDRLQAEAIRRISDMRVSTEGWDGTKETSYGNLDPKQQERIRGYLNDDQYLLPQTKILPVKGKMLISAKCRIGPNVWGGSGFGLTMAIE